MFLALAEKLAWSLVLYYLKKSGKINTVEAFGLKEGTRVIQAVENIKTYPDYTGLGDK